MRCICMQAVPVAIFFSEAEANRALMASFVRGGEGRVLVVGGCVCIRMKVESHCIVELF